MTNLIFERIRAKVTRAEQHIQDFQLGLSDFFDSKPYDIAVKENAQAGKRIYYLRKVDPTPDALAAIASDVVQNLRSSLDHLAYQLVLDACGGAKPDWKVYYPIAGSAAYYKATRNGVIKGVRQAVIDAIDATEPYKGGKGHALWQLNKLGNPDKHQLLIGADPYSRNVDISGSIVEMFRRHHGRDVRVPPIRLRPADRGPMKVGHELLVEPLDHEMTQNYKFAFDVSFYVPGVVEGEPALKTLKDLSNLVGDIVHGFGPFFK